MYPSIYYYSISIFILLNFYCYASPVATTSDQQLINPINKDLSPNNQLKFKEYFYLKMLCKRYGRCHDEEDDGDDAEDVMNDDDTKQKRLSSKLFHGIPKFGKRALTSAFAGLPKFG